MGGFPLAKERSIDIPSPLSPPFVKGRGFLLEAPLRLRRSNPSLAGAPRRAQGKGRAIRRGSEHSVANPSQYLRWGRLPFGERESIDIPSPLSPPFVKGRGFLSVPRFGCAARIPIWQGPRGERKGKGARCDAAASIAWPIPLNQDGALHYLV